MLASGLILTLIGVAALLYFLPAFIAFSRKIPNALPLFLVNLLLGWSGLAWLACLLWAIIETPPQQRRYYDDLADRARDDRYRAAGPPALPGGGDGVPEWFYANDGATSGPHSRDEMAHFARIGVFRPETLCWKPSFGDKWQPYERLLLAAPARER